MSMAAHRVDFVEFRNRLKRLVESLVALRNLPPPERPWPASPERVEMTLEADAIQVEFLVGQLPWNVAMKLVHDFQRTFAKFAPVFLDSYTDGFALEKSREQDGGYGRIHDKTTLRIKTELFERGCSIVICTTAKDFNDHFARCAALRSARVRQDVEHESDCRRSRSAGRGAALRCPADEMVR